MGKRRTYTDAEKSAALTAYVEIGPSKAAKLVGLPYSTIRSWAKTAGLRSERNEKTAEATAAAAADAALNREIVRRGLMGLSRSFVEQVEKLLEMDGDAVIRNLIIASGNGQFFAEMQRFSVTVGTLIDKYRLEMGEHTGREQRDVFTHDSSPEEIRTELEKFRKLRLVKNSAS